MSKPFILQAACITFAISIGPAPHAGLHLVDDNPLGDIAVIGATDTWFDADPERKTIPTLNLISKDRKTCMMTLRSSCQDTPDGWDT